jgi:MFS transporter, DHA1 family, tetracycline resistance protein
MMILRILFVGFMLYLNFQDVSGHTLKRKSKILAKRSSTKKVLKSAQLAQVSKCRVDNVLATSEGKSKEMLGFPRVLIPLYFSFILDSIALGMFLPVLPFHAMRIGATPVTLSYITVIGNIGSTLGAYLAGMIGDIFGRKLVSMIASLAATVAYVMAAKAPSVLIFMIARFLSNITGGMMPVVQTSVTDVAAPDDRARYFGRTTALFGFSFVFGALLNRVMSSQSSELRILIAGAMTFVGFISVTLFSNVPVPSSAMRNTLQKSSTSKLKTSCSTTSSVVMKHSHLLPHIIACGFLLAFGFSSESLYAVFMKEKLNHDENILSILFCVNGLLCGMANVILPKILYLFGNQRILTLMFSTFAFSAGMIGFAMIHNPHFLHYAIFTMHLVAFSISDTCQSSLVSQFSGPDKQGQNLGINQSIQGIARITAPLLAGWLTRKGTNHELPFIIGSIFPFMSIVLYYHIYLKIQKTQTSDIRH